MLTKWRTLSWYSNLLKTLIFQSLFFDLHIRITVGLSQPDPRLREGDVEELGANRRSYAGPLIVLFDHFHPNP